MEDKTKKLIIILWPSLLGALLFTTLLFTFIFCKCINFSFSTNIVLCVLLVCILCFLVFMQVICLKETHQYKMDINEENINYLKEAIEHFEKEKNNED